jgi:TM2 domain-containing membrane protein YozV
MQNGGFGRKGLGEGASFPMQGALAAPRFAAPGPAIAAKRAAFLAAERERASGSGLDGLRNSEPTPIIEEEDLDAEEILRQSYHVPDAKQKSMILAYVLWYFAGPLAAHRFYLGANGSAIQQAAGFWGGLLVLGIGVSVNVLAIKFLGGAFMVMAMLWILADIFFIPSLCRTANAAALRSHKIFE